MIKLYSKINCGLGPNRVMLIDDTLKFLDADVVFKGRIMFLQFKTCCRFSTQVFRTSLCSRAYD